MSLAETVLTVGTLGLGLWRLSRPVWTQAAAFAAALIEPDEEEESEPTVSTVEAPDYGQWLDEEEEPERTGPLAAWEWIEFLNDRPNEIPHIAAFGPSGAGKSTLILALLKSRAGQLVITTIKNEADDYWGGFPAVRLGFRRDDDDEIEPDWSPIGDAIEAVYREVNARHADGKRPRTPLTLVIDELTATINAIGKQRIVPRLIHMWLTARSVGVRLIVMDPTANVAGWGLDGRGDVRDSIVFVRCERDKSAMFGTLDECRADDASIMDTSEVPGLASGVLDPARVWIPVGGMSKAKAVPTQETIPVSSNGFAAPTSAMPTDYEAVLVQAWYDGGDKGMRSLARRLYEARGGEPPYDGSGGPYYAVRAALATEAGGRYSAL